MDGSAYGILLVMFSFVHRRSFRAQIVLTLFMPYHSYHYTPPHRFGFAISFAINNEVVLQKIWEECQVREGSPSCSA
jgi:hypothetical protein